MSEELDRSEEERLKLEQKLNEQIREARKASAKNDNHPPHQHSDGHGGSHGPQIPIMSSCGHSSLFSQLQVHISRVDNVIQQSAAISKRLASLPNNSQKSFPLTHSKS